MSLLSSASVSRGTTLRLVALPCCLVLAFLAATMVGSVAISPVETVQIWLYKMGLYHAQTSWPLPDQTIVWDLRLPRVVGAGLVGFALAIAGTLFQAVLRNPLADPYVIGTSAGAQLGVSLALLFQIPWVILGFGAVQVLSFVGAIVTVLFVYSIARTSGKTPVVTLLLAGFVVSSFLISGTSFIMSISNRANEILSWTMGGMNVSRWDQVSTMGPLIVGGGAVALLLSGRLDVLQLGEEQASHLGLRIERLKVGAIILAAFLTALAVTLAGVVAFVGLIVPHSARLLYGPNHRLLIPTAGCGGALFVIVADAFARVVLAPNVVPLGAVTALIGAPFFLQLLRTTKRVYGL